MKYVVSIILFLAAWTLGSEIFALTPSEANIAILGDSNTWIGGDDCSKPKGWNHWFAEALNPSSCRSYARSGATWSHTPGTKENVVENIGVIGDDNVIFNQIRRLENAVGSGEQVIPDVIIVAAGTNDLLFPRRRPKAMAGPEEGVQSVVGALAADLQRLRSSFPDARIVVMTPIQCVKIDNKSLIDLSDRMDMVASQLGATIVRMDRYGAVRRDEELKSRRNTYDGIHTSETGARANGELMARRIADLLSMD